jgi:hypothetical protein
MSTPCIVPLSPPPPSRPAGAGGAQHATAAPPQPDAAATRRRCKRRAPQRRRCAGAGASAPSQRLGFRSVSLSAVVNNSPTQPHQQEGSKPDLCRYVDRAAAVGGRSRITPPGRASDQAGAGIGGGRPCGAPSWSAPHAVLNRRRPFCFSVGSLTLVASPTACSACGGQRPRVCVLGGQA